VEGSDLVFITAGTVANSRAMGIVGDFCKGNVVICPRNSLCIVASLRAHGRCADVEVRALNVDTFAACPCSISSSLLILLRT
jgi:hypothetical protein